MAYARRSPHQRDSPPHSPRKYPLRRSPSSRRPRHATEDRPNCPSTRQVLVPLHPNLRRLPSRLHSVQHSPVDKDPHMARHAAQVGSKRKRVASVTTSNENTSHATRASRSKRLRSETLTRTQDQEYSTTSEDDGQEESEDGQADLVEDDHSEMDVDTVTVQGSDSDDSNAGTDADDDGENQETQDASSNSEDEDESSDEHLLNFAPRKQLFRLRKDELIHLYGLTGLTDEPDLLTKSDLVSAIISSRDEFAELPPSSPPGHGDGNSSEYSSDDGNVAGDEETDAGVHPSRRPSGSNVNLRRRATLGDVTKVSARPMKGRSASLDQLVPHQTNGLPAKRKHPGVKLSTVPEVIPRRRTSNRSSPSNSTTASVSSPVRTRLRSKKSSTSSLSTPTNKSAGKGKHVEFSKTQVTPKGGKAKQHDGGQENDRWNINDEESDLTELEELEASLLKQPSPRRLRSNDKGSQEIINQVAAKSLRKTPVRKAKGKTKSLKEEDEEDEVLSVGEDELSDDGVDEDAAEEEEVDELVSSTPATPTPPPYKGRRTPLKTRLRPRRRPGPPSDGDDEGDTEEGLQHEDDEIDAGEGDVAEDDEETLTAEPRKLRNGKIVEDVTMEDEDAEEAEEEEEDIEEVEEGEGEEEEVGGEEEGAGEEEVVDEEDQEDEVDAEDVDVDAEAEPDEDVMEEDDVDLTVATAKTLIRLRRDDLIRLCETRDLEPIGTKPQLAEALLQWRDRQNHDGSSPSSSGTIRPSTGSRRKRTRNGTRTFNSSPASSQFDHTIHEEKPETLVPTHAQREKEEADLELDLESLGLEDREIPPEKLQKLEKIGSGGFKDVFIGKFKGRKIAISEFRGQLSAMDIKELKLLGGFDHPNIVRFLGVSIPENTKETPVMIVSELCSNGDLFDYVRNVHPPSLHKVLVIMLDIARGLEYLHQRKPSVIHRDCKSSNILITAKGTAKIADFGLAKVKQSTRSMVRSLVGTVNWQAPELWHAHPKYNHKVDVFSCAMVFWEMLQWHLPNKKFPWEGMNEHAIYEIVGAKRQRPSVSGLRKQWCPEIIDLIERMWAQDHQDRPTMTEVVEALEEMITHR